MSLADTDVEDHDDGGLGDDYNDEMVDEEDDDFHENRVIEVRWREALHGLDHLQVLGQPGAASGLIEVAAEPFEGVNVDDLLSFRRPLGFERRRQTGRTSFERSVTEINGFQHPLLLRPSQSGDLVSMWSSGTNSSRDLEALSAGNFDVAHFYMFDAPVLPYDHMPTSLFGDRLGGAAPPPLTDYSIGMDSFQMVGRRGPGDGRWTDDGQPQGSSQATIIAQAVEEHFISQLRSIAPANTHAERQTQSSGLQHNQQLDAPLSNDSQPAEGGDNTGSQRSEGQHEENSNETANHQISQTVETVSCQEHVALEAVEEAGECLEAHEPMSIQSLVPNETPNVHDGMEISDGNGTSSEPVERMPELVTLSADLHGDQQCPGGPEMLANLHGSPIEPGNSDRSSGMDDESNNREMVNSGLEIPNAGDGHANTLHASADVDMNGASTEDQTEQIGLLLNMTDQNSMNSEAPSANAIDPTFLEALPEDLRQNCSPPDIQAEVLAQQRAQRVAQQAEGQPVDMDNASIIATFPAELREEVLLTSSEAVLSALPSPLIAEAQMLRDRAMSHYQARSLFGTSHRLNNRRNDSLKVKEIDGEPLLGANALKALIRLLRLAQPLGKGLLQRLLLNLCVHSGTRAILVRLLLDMIKPEAEGSIRELATVNSQRLYGCQSNVVYGRSQLLDGHSFTGLPPVVLRRVIEILTYLATNHPVVANLLFYFDPSSVVESSSPKYTETKKDKCKEKIVEGGVSPNPSGSSQQGDVPLILFLKLLDRPISLQSIAHLDQVMNLLQVVVNSAASKLECQTQSEQATDDSQNLPANEASDGKKCINTYDIFLQLPQSDLHNLCSLLGYEGLPDKVYKFAGEVLKKLASVAVPHRKFFTSELSDLAHHLSSSAVSELVTLRNTHMLGLSAASMAGAAILRVLQVLSSLNSPNIDGNKGMESDGEPEEQTIIKPFCHASRSCHITAREVKEFAGSSAPLSTKYGGDSQRRLDGSVTFVRFAEKHRRLLNAFIRQNPGLLEKSLSLVLKAPRLIDFDNKRAYFRSRIRQQHEQHLSGPLRISVRRAYVLEDSYNQLRLRPTQELKGRLNVAKALFDGQLLDVYFTRSFYKHILGVKVTYHDIEAVDPDYYKNLKWMLENDVSCIPEMTFSMDPDEEKHILYEKTEEYKGHRRKKHEYIDLVAEHILTNAIRPQINSFLEGFNELVPRELISIFNDKELELLISGLPEIDLDDLKANTEYTGYTAASSVVQWFWEVVKAFNKEDMARLLQFVTGTSRLMFCLLDDFESLSSINLSSGPYVPLDGFKALQGISGPQKFQIHKAYGAPERLPSAHTCFNQLDLPEYSSKEQLQERLLLAIHEASEGFGFG
ncbi:E3 ubiquitin-protein ligase UPL1 [Vitis vinifera]|uniref:HECT-type E3 ubiquitin transferase n=1 Tax=Vitis vinifera TaxID=29760 RepID=A0A438EQP9_VITVI|nr:E3 ubiquitin-protein ligase UPL1 [Vitis vinifera]